MTMRGLSLQEKLIKVISEARFTESGCLEASLAHSNGYPAIGHMRKRLCT